jgi:Ca2+-binding EF-hand superfamily protein
MNTKSTYALVLVLAAGTAGAADKDRPETKQEVQAVFAALDRDDDRRISKQEAAREGSLRKRFAAVDSSGDGYLSQAEYEARPRDEPFE